MIYISAFFLFLFPLFVLFPQATEKTKAPLNPANLRVIVVCPTNCDYSSIQSAVDLAEPGDTIQVRTGVYKESIWITKSGTPDKPITLMAYPGDVPTIDPTGTGHGGNASPDQKGINISNGAKWWIIDGFEIRGGFEGIKIQPGGSSNITIRNNYIHDNSYDGIFVGNANDIYIANNEIHSIGIDPDECIVDGVHQPTYCHGIYIKDYDSTGISKITIRSNYIHTGAGTGIAIYPNGTDILVENNLVINYGRVLLLAGTSSSIVRNNTFVLANPPPLDPTRPQYRVLILGKYGNQPAVNNIIVNNIIHIEANSFHNYPVWVMQTPNDSAIDTWIVNNNLWYAPANTQWIWKDSLKTDFNSQYKSITGWDKNGPPIPSDPMFVDPKKGNYKLGSLSSPAVNNGSVSNYSEIDFDGKLRDEHPDIGAYEY